MSGDDDEEKEVADLKAKLKAAQREHGKLTHELDQLSAELREVMEAMRRDGVSEEEIQRILAEDDDEEADDA